LPQNKHPQRGLDGGMSKFLFRPQRGSLAASMNEVRKFGSKGELIDFLQKENKRHDCKRISIEKYGEFDDRIGWNTHIVVIDGCGVAGFTSGPVEK
jgi:hypothetical protein